MRPKQAIWIWVLLVAFGVGFFSSAHAADKIVWKAQCWVGVTDLAYKSFERLCANVKSATGGRLEIVPHPDGAIVPAIQMLDAIKSNVIQAMNGAPIYWSGKDPAFALLGDLNAAWTSPWEADAYFQYHGGLELLREAYKPFGVYPVGVTWVGLEVMPSKKCVKQISDFQGLKLRAPQGIPAEFFKRMGASVVILPGGEVYSSMEKGIIDATDWGTPSMNYRMKFHEVAKFYNYPGFHSMATMDFTVNQSEWDKLPDDIKAILKIAARDFAWDMVETGAVDSAAAMREMKAKGVTECVWTDEEIAKARKIAQGVWEDWSNKSPLCKKVYDSVTTYLKSIGKL